MIPSYVQHEPYANMYDSARMTSLARAKQIAQPTLQEVGEFDSEKYSALRRTIVY